MKFSCKFCPKKFTYGYNLKLHENIHRGNKNYSCDICEKKFVQHFNLKASMKELWNLKVGQGKFNGFLHHNECNQSFLNDTFLIQSHLRLKFVTIK